jgi:hypothetical protein
MTIASVASVFVDRRASAQPPSDVEEGEEEEGVLDSGDPGAGAGAGSSVGASGIGCESVRFSKNAQSVRLASGPFGSANDPPALPPDHDRLRA